MFVKVKSDAKTRDKIMHSVDSLNAKVVDTGESTLTVEEIGDTKKINRTLELLRPFGIIEIVRTGKIAIQTEGEKSEE